MGGIIDIPAMVAGVPQGEWVNEVLTHVDDAVVRLGVIQGEYHWHSHGAQEEFFLTLTGELLLDMRGPDGEVTVTLPQHHGYTVPVGVEHRTRAPERTSILMVEQATVIPAGDD